MTFPFSGLADRFKIFLLLVLKDNLVNLFKSVVQTKCEREKVNVNSMVSLNPGLGWPFMEMSCLLGFLANDIVDSLW